MGFMKRKHNIMITDGSDRNVLNNILGIIGMVAYSNGGKFNVNKLDQDHPTTMVIRYNSSSKNSEIIKGILDGLYPGLCNYDVVL